MEAIKSLGSWEEIMQALKDRLAEQQGRHQGGNKWIGTGGTSPFGHGGYNPEGVRIGGPGRHGRAIKVWEKREFRDLDGTQELGTRNIKVALRRLRRFAREGAAEELDLDGTIDGTARRGWLDVKLRPERHNAGQDPAIPRYRRLDGWACEGRRGAVLGLPRRVQAPRAFLFPQLHLRGRVEG
jgi:uncharacterized protein with von Willebrand factor type A (vWA) domain